MTTINLDSLFENGELKRAKSDEELFNNVQLMLAAIKAYLSDQNDTLFPQIQSFFNQMRQAQEDFYAGCSKLEESSQFWNHCSSLTTEQKSKLAEGKPLFGESNGNKLHIFSADQPRRVFGDLHCYVDGLKATITRDYQERHEFSHLFLGDLPGKSTDLEKNLTVMLLMLYWWYSHPNPEKIIQLAGNHDRNPILKVDLTKAFFSNKNAACMRDTQMMLMMSLSLKENCVLNFFDSAFKVLPVMALAISPENTTHNVLFAHAALPSPKKMRALMAYKLKLKAKQTKFDLEGFRQYELAIQDQTDQEIKRSLLTLAEENQALIKTINDSFNEKKPYLWEVLSNWAIQLLWGDWIWKNNQLTFEVPQEGNPSRRLGEGVGVSAEDVAKVHYAGEGALTAAKIVGVDEFNCGHGHEVLSQEVEEVLFNMLCSTDLFWGNMMLETKNGETKKLNPVTREAFEPREMMLPSNTFSFANIDWSTPLLERHNQNLDSAKNIMKKQRNNPSCCLPGLGHLFALFKRKHAKVSSAAEGSGFHSVCGELKRVDFKQN